MKHIFGLCEDYDKIVYGLKNNLTLVRKTDADAIFRLAAVGAGKVSLNKISWLMPHVIPADAEKFSIYKTIAFFIFYLKFLHIHSIILR